MGPEVIESGTVIGGGNRAAWLAGREGLLGASEAAAALGVCPYRTPVELWQEKTGRGSPREESEAMTWGSLLEPVILGEYERRTGAKVQARQLFVRHPEHPFMAATLDGMTSTGKLVEVKTTSAWSKGFGDEDADELPDSYRVQVHQQFAVTGADAADLVVLVGGQRLKVYPVARDEALVREVVRGCVAFWRCVEGRTPPAWGRVTAQTLAVLHPGCDGEVELPREVAALVDEVDLCNASIRGESTARDEARLRVLKAMGNYKVGRLPDGRVVKRYLEEVKERTTVTKAHTRHYFRILKGHSE